MSTPDLSRRNFILRDPERKKAKDFPWDMYFSSYGMAYAQVNEAGPFLEDDARRLGIDMTGKSDLEILKEIFATSDQPPV